MKIFYKLVAGYLFIASLVWIVGLYSVAESQRNLQGAIIKDSELFAETTLDKIDRAIFSKLETFQEYQTDLILQRAVMASNAKFEKLKNIQEYINNRDIAWRSASALVATPLMRKLMDNELSHELNEKLSFYQETYGYRVFGEVFITNKYGANVAQTGRTTDYQQSDEEWWQSARDKGLYIGEVAYDESAGMYAIDFGIRIDDAQDNFIGVIKAVLNIENVIQMLAGLQTGSSTYSLIRHNGNIIYSTKPFSFLEQSSYLSALGNDERSHVKRKTGGDGDILTIHTYSKGYRNFKGLGWILIVEHATKDIFAPAAALQRNIYLFATVVTLMALLMGIFLSRTIATPIRHLKKFAEDFQATGMNQRIKISASDEVGALADSFNHMVERLQKTTVSRDDLQREIEERKLLQTKYFKLSQAIEQAGEAILITDKEGTIEYVNPAFSQITGYPAEEVIGHTPKVLNADNHEAAFYDKLWDTITSGNAWHGKLMDKKKDGSFFPTQVSISPLRDSNGEITSFIGIHVDLTEQQCLEEQFQQSQKMQAIGTLVGGIAHNFNNMLAGLTGNLYLARQMAKDQPKLASKLDRAEQLSFQAAETVAQLLAFARKDSVQFTPIPFTRLVREAFKLHQVSIPENIHLAYDICPQAMQVMGNTNQLQQILLNLINNAQDAVEDTADPRITVKLESLTADEAFLAMYPNIQGRHFAHLSVKDNGCGIPAGKLAFVFDPFFTLKEVGKGTGLGLSMAYGSITSHGGIIDVESVLGEGSTFHVYLPVLETETRTETIQENGDIALGHGETILLADDEKYVRETAREVLEHLGYKVLLVEDGKEAVDMLAARGSEIDMIILDVVMPVMGGVEAASHMMETNPGTPIVFATGYDKNSMGQGLESLDQVVLSKPFTILQLSQILHKALHPQK
ncbi:MAG: PAS domain S-box protein [Mariprofundaceae bacterium]